MTADEPLNFEQALQHAVKMLGDAETARQDAQDLLCFVLACQPVTLFTYGERRLNSAQQQQFLSLLTARKTGQPIAYLTGQRGFWNLNLQVTADTLIPRPDTECLVQLALQKLGQNGWCADLGTGSGAIALALAKERPDCRFLATDRSLPALKVARQNALSHQLKNVDFVLADWGQMLQAGCLDMLVSNPPYIVDNDPHLSQGDLRFEPRAALAAGTDGLDDIRQIVMQAITVLKKNGWLLIEHGYQQSTAVQQLFIDAGFFDVTSHQDWGQRDRVVCGQRP